MTTTDPGRHQRIHAGARVPTNRSHAHCECGLHVTLPCPRHLPALYALDAAQHRALPDTTITNPRYSPTTWVLSYDTEHGSGGASS